MSDNKSPNEIQEPKRGKVLRGPEPSTLCERLDALNAKLDRVLAETRGVGILAPVPPHGPKAGRR